jgi:hypothetical protein
MSKLECGCDITDHRPSGEFLLFAGKTLLGRSELEWEDEGAGVWLRSGSFAPAQGYWQFQDLFQRYGKELMAARLAQNNYNRAALEKLEAEIGKLQLRLVHPDGREIPVASFELQDCADTLSEDPRELKVEIRDRAIHDMYFSQPIV